MFITLRLSLHDLTLLLNVQPCLFKTDGLVNEITNLQTTSELSDSYTKVPRTLAPGEQTGGVAVCDKWINIGTTSIK